MNDQSIKEGEKEKKNVQKTRDRDRTVFLTRYDCVGQGEEGRETQERRLDRIGSRSNNNEMSAADGDVFCVLRPEHDGDSVSLMRILLNFERRYQNG